MKEQKLPKRMSHTNVGITSEELLASVLGMFANVIPTPTCKDLGIDMRAELFDGVYPTGIHFNVQCKGKEEVEEVSKQKDWINVQVNVSTLNYWRQQGEPTFLIVVDKKENRFYWCCPLIQLSDKYNSIQNQATVVVKISIHNYFKIDTNKLPQGMLGIIYDYHFDIVAKVIKLLSSIDDDINNVSYVTGEQYEKIVHMNQAVNNIFDSLNIIKKITDKINCTVLKSINTEIENYSSYICALDYYPEVRGYIRASSVYDERFGEDIPRFVIKDVRDALNNYTLNKSSDNFKIVIDSVNKLQRLNRNLKGFLREIESEFDWS